MDRNFGTMMCVAVQKVLYVEDRVEKMRNFRKMGYI